MEVYIKSSWLVFLLGLFCLTITLSGVQGDVDGQGPTESECRPYIEKALKDLEAGETENTEPLNVDFKNSNEELPTIEITTDDSNHSDSDVNPDSIETNETEEVENVEEDDDDDDDDDNEKENGEIDGDDESNEQNISTEEVLQQEEINTEDHDQSQETSKEGENSLENKENSNEELPIAENSQETVSQENEQDKSKEENDKNESDNVASQEDDSVINKIVSDIDDEQQPSVISNENVDLNSEKENQENILKEQEILRQQEEILRQEEILKEQEEILSIREKEILSATEEEVISDAEEEETLTSREREILASVEETPIQEEEILVRKVREVSTSVEEENAPGSEEVNKEEDIDTTTASVEEEVDAASETESAEKAETTDEKESIEETDTTQISTEEPPISVEESIIEETTESSENLIEETIIAETKVDSEEEQEQTNVEEVEEEKETESKEEKETESKEEKEADSKEEKEADSKEEKEADSIEEKEADSKEDKEADSKEEKEDDSKEEKEIESQEQKDAESKEENEAESKEQKEIESKEEKEDSKSIEHEDSQSGEKTDKDQDQEETNKSERIVEKSEEIETQSVAEDNEPQKEDVDESTEDANKVDIDAAVEDLVQEEKEILELRPREHVNQILKLDEESSEIEQVIGKTSEVILKDLKRLYESAIKPLETLYKYRDLSNRHFGDAEIFSKPLILFMGPWSGGKSSIINYLLDVEYNETNLHTGAEPSPAYFNIVMYGEEPEILDGTELAADYTFSGLQKFGQGLEERLRGYKLPSKLLQKVNVVEIPGILEVRKQVSRVFPFNDACQWFIDRADIIFLVYDPSKLDVGPETEAILDQLKGREYQTRIVLNKADQVKPEELMRVQGALIWNISPLMSSAQPPVMYTTSLWSKPYESWAPVRLLQAQERAFLRDLRVAIEKRIDNKIASARRFAVRVRNHAKMVDCYLTTYYNHKSVFGNRKQVSDEIINHPQDYHIYEGLSTLTNISRYDLPDPDVYRDFFKLNALYEFQQLSATCTYFRGCPINRLDVAIAYDLPELVGKNKRLIETSLNKLNTATPES